MMGQRELEMLELLDGSRRKRVAPKAAVRIEDLSALLEIPPKLKSVKAAGDPPTQAEFDALVDDVHAIHRRIAAVAAVLQARLLG